MAAERYPKCVFHCERGFGIILHITLLHIIPCSNMVVKGESLWTCQNGLPRFAGEFWDFGILYFAAYQQRATLRVRVSDIVGQMRAPRGNGGNIISPFTPAAQREVHRILLERIRIRAATQILQLNCRRTSLVGDDVSRVG